MAVPTKAVTLENVRNDVLTIDAKVLLLAEKLKTFERNETVLANTIVKLDGRLKTLEATSGTAGGASSAELKAVRAEVDELKKNMASREEVKELKYVLDSINPLEYATIDQVHELLNEKLKELQK